MTNDDIEWLFEGLHALLDTRLSQKGWDEDDKDPM